jgi:hypothetical protein
LQKLGCGFLIDKNNAFSTLNKLKQSLYDLMILKNKGIANKLVFAVFFEYFPVCRSPPLFWLFYPLEVFEN